MSAAPSLSYEQLLVASSGLDGTMFRKKQDVAERSRSLLKNSAAKKIKAEILAALPTLTKDVIDELMPNKVRLHAHSHTAHPT